jgi:HEAT repeat protein
MRIFLILTFFLPGLAFGQTVESKTAVAAGSTHDRARYLLENSLKDKNPDVRKHAVQSLGLVSPTEPYVSQLEAMLDDKDVQVRVATIASLVDLNGDRTMPALRRALDSDVPEVSFAAAKELWTLNDSSGREALVAVLSGDTKTSSGFITKQKRDALRMFHTPQTLFVFALKQGAAFAPGPGLGAGISSVQGILSDPGVSGRAATGLLLSVDKSPEILGALEDALADSDWSVRAAAVHAIAVRNDPALKADLVPLLDDKKEAVRVRAAAGYLRLEAISSQSAKSAKRSPAKPAAIGKNE